MFKKLFCNHKLTFQREYIDYMGWKVYVYKCDKCNKTVKKLTKL